MDEMLIEFGSAVKAMDDGTLGGYLVLFGTPADADDSGEFFTKGTDFGLDITAKSAVLYHHGFDRTLKARRVGQADLGVDDIGVWIKAQLDLRDEYERAVYALAKSGKLGWSSGTAAHLVRKKSVGGATEITAWPLGLDASLTPTPADPRNRVMPLKSWKEQAGEADPLALKAAAVEEADDDATKATFDTAGSGMTAYDRPSASRMPQAVTDLHAKVQRVVEAVGSGGMTEKRAVKTLGRARALLDAACAGTKSATDFDDFGELTLADHAAAVVSANAGYAERLVSRQEARTKSGRVLSQANRDEIKAVAESLKTTLTRLEDLLDKALPTEPEPETKSADPPDWLRELARSEELLASLNGVPVFA